jgi:tetraacyldisaccharide 4'-kinase
VISVGNLHWGGGGKTPFTAALARHLRGRELTPCILSRGYRGKGRGVRLVSAGEGPLLGPTTAGDEPVQLAGELPGVPVVVATDRYEAGRHALERLEKPPDLFLLDDGFSHLGLARDLDLLLFPAADPFAGGLLPPGGRLREPLASTRWADAVVLTGDGQDRGAELARALTRHGFRGPGFSSRTEHLAPVPSEGTPLPPGTRVLAVCGVARPAGFLAAADASGLDVRDKLTFPDHHPYPASSLRRISEALRTTGAEWVLTTGKDRVKLLGRLDAPLAEIPVRARPEEAFWVWLDQRLSEIVG